jgi:protein-tyrosine phosphatase
MKNLLKDGGGILFVCTGNIARSPFMALTLANRIASSSAQGLPVSSAGTYASAGAPIHPEVAAELRNRGIDSSGFAASQLTADRIMDAGLILTASREHRRLVARLAPARRNVTFTLRQFVRLIQLDPVGEIRMATDGPLDALAQLANRNRGLSGGSQDDDDITDPVNAPRRQFGLAFAAIDPAISVLGDLVNGLRDLPRRQA